MDEELEAFCTRSLADTTYPYVFLDATYIKGRVGGQVVSRAVVVAMGVTKEGNREILGLSIGDSRGQCLLDRVPPEPPGPGAHRRRARHLRCSSGPEGRH